MALGENTVNRVRGCKPQTAAKYSPALELYAASRLSVAEICRRCGVSVSGFSRYISAYHRQLMLERNGIRCTPAEAADIKINPRRGQFPAVRARYRDAIAACDSMDYIEYNVSEIAREFGLDGTNLANQLRRHYPGVLEFREQARRRLGLADNLPRGVRPWCEEQYAGAVELLRADRYVTVQDAADLCNVSCTGLEQHLIFYHSDLVENRIGIRKRAVSRRLPGESSLRQYIRHHFPELITRRKLREGEAGQNPISDNC